MALLKKHKLRKDVIQKEDSELQAQLWSLGPPPGVAEVLWPLSEDHKWFRPPVFHVAINSPSTIYCIRGKSWILGHNKKIT
jgi:hypothetical protein